jgi:hypothetical protein
MCGPIPRVRGPAALSVHHGLEQWSGGGLTPVSGSSPRVGEKGEDSGGVLTECTKGRHGGRISRATVFGGGGRRGSVGTCFAVERERKE